MDHAEFDVHLHSYKVDFHVLGCRLLGAEEAILKAGGIAIRLAGLYHAGR